jgi:hypothetical protein
MRNQNSKFDASGVCVRRALSDAFRAHKAHAARKGWKTTRKALKAAARRFPMFHVY